MAVQDKHACQQRSDSTNDAVEAERVPKRKLSDLYDLRSGNRSIQVCNKLLKLLEEIE
jgi:hypothetical protein